MKLLGLNLDTAINDEVQSVLLTQDSVELVSLSDSNNSLAGSPGNVLDGVEAVLMGPKTINPIQITQVFSRLNSGLALLILCPPESYTTLSKEIQFTPFIGREVRCVPHVQGKVADEVDGLLARARTRLQYQNLLKTTSKSLDVLPPPPPQVEPLLGELMEALPVGVILMLDETVIATNARASAMVSLEILEPLPPEIKRQFEGSHPTLEIEGRTVEVKRSHLKSKRSVTDLIILHDVTELMKVRQEIVEARAMAASAEARARSAAKLKELNIALKKAKDEAMAASKAKSAFLANMSHELRTPLNAIIGFAELLVDEAFGTLNKKQSRYGSNILTSGYHLLHLINDLLDIAKIEAGRVILDLEEVHLSVSVSEIVSILDELAKENDVVLEKSVPRPLRVMADRARLNQILYNLINNAIKFSPGGKVRVHVFEDGPATARFCVEDNGKGLTRENLDRVFDRFEQIDPGEVTGTGLGLSITKKLVELHGGTIWVESEGPGRGCRFQFTINKSLE